MQEITSEAIQVLSRWDFGRHDPAMNHEVLAVFLEMQNREETHHRLLHVLSTKCSSLSLSLKGTAASIAVGIIQKLRGVRFMVQLLSSSKSLLKQDIISMNYPGSESFVV